MLIFFSWQSNLSLYVNLATFLENQKLYTYNSGLFNFKEPKI
ncbi:hypothetical protein FORMA_06480 [Formosa sp. Hel3_A1_48]|nr:hypothetical protein FORMA_06480 [Formosa sp. Hel3_A1_48]